MVRHFLAVLAYRTQKALRGAPPGFGGLDPGADIRSPLEILKHINDLIERSLNRFAEGAGTIPRVEATWQAEVGRFPALLAALDTALTEGDWPHEVLKRLLQGPLADAMTHAGQLALLRRLAGSPLPGENFYAADIRTGTLDYD